MIFHWVYFIGERVTIVMFGVLVEGDRGMWVGVGGGGRGAWGWGVGSGMGGGGVAGGYFVYSYLLLFLGSFISCFIVYSWFQLEACIFITFVTFFISLLYIVSILSTTNVK